MGESERKISTEDVLKVIAAGGIVIASAMIPSLPVAIMSVYKVWKDVNKSDLGRIIKRLEKQEMISIRHIENKIQIKITDHGKKRLLEYDYEHISLKAKRRDGKWRLIIFDVPENKKRNRDAFVRKLLQFGCIRLQDSVYANAFPCKSEVDFLSHFLEISDYVTVVKLDRIERGEQLIFKKFQDLELQ